VNRFTWRRNTLATSIQLANMFSVGSWRMSRRDGECGQSPARELVRVESLDTGVHAV